MRFPAFTAIVLVCTAGSNAAIDQAGGSVTPGPAGDPTFTISAAGDRTGTGTGAVRGLDDVNFRVTSTGISATGECTTGTGSGTTGPGTGRCIAPVTAPPGSRTYTVTQQPPPPEGWYANEALGTGSVSGNAVTRSTYNSLTATNIGQDANPNVPAQVRTNSSNYWALSRDNPVLSPRCGLHIALLVDLSGSVSPHLADYKRAGVAFVDALEGTPSSIAVYTFATTSPAASTSNYNNRNTPLQAVSTQGGANIVRSKINGLTIPSGTQQYTNWDAGLWQIAHSNDHYDVAIVLTDGNPNRYSVSSGSGVPTQFRDVEYGIFSANALKARRTAVEPGTTVKAVGIAVPGNSHYNLRAISGTRLGTGTSPGDYYTTGWEGLGGLLETLARENCRGTINVTKLVVPAGGELSQAVEAPGWTFTIDPADAEGMSSRETGETGGVSFPTGNSDVARTITETGAPGPGYTLIQQGEFNAACVDTSEAGTVGREVTDVNNGFTVTPDPTGTINCTVYNQAPQGHSPAYVRVDKTWMINGQRVPEGGQPANFESTLTLDGEPAVWGEPFPGYVEGQKVIVGEQGVRVPAGCTIQGPATNLGEHILGPGENVINVENTVTCQTSVVVYKTWSEDGDQPVPNGEQPAYLESTLTLNPNPSGLPVNWGTEVTGYNQGQVVYVGETPSLPLVCTNVASGDLGRQTLSWGLNEFHVTDTVTCGLSEPLPEPLDSAVVDKTWVINGVPYAQGSQPRGFGSTLILNGHLEQWGQTVFGFEGEVFSVGETVTVPRGCTVRVAPPLPFLLTLTEAETTFEVTNTATCAATPKPPRPPNVNVNANAYANASSRASANGPVIARPRASANGNSAYVNSNASGSAYAPSFAFGGGSQ